MDAIGTLWSKYRESTPGLLRLTDVYLAYILLTGVIQFVYCCLVGTFPFNSFLAGFISTVGSFVLTGKYYCKKNKYLLVCLRIQVGPNSPFKNVSKERAFFDYLFANLILHLWVFNFMG
jgi:oligosaccharyltransferase complex subunit epsilon